MKKVIVNITIAIMVCITMLFGFGMVSNAIYNNKDSYVYDVEMSASLQVSVIDPIETHWEGYLETEVFIGNKGELIIPEDISDTIHYELKLTWDLK